MGEKRGTKALELWCRRITDGYTGVSVQNMTTSWRDGLAFCAMIHHFRPDLIEFDSLDKNDIYGNNELAFRIAEQHLGIPALLDAEDMASCSVPDRLSILTYLSQFYQTFGGSSPARLAVNRTTETTDGITEIPESPKEKEPPYMGMRKDLCAVCGLPVFLAEKLVLAHISYHRTCFRCARCNSQLTLGNYYETEEGQYCCETCPDEEISSPTINNSVFSCETAKTRDTAESIHGHSSDEDSAVNGIFNRNLTKQLDYKDAYIPDLIAQTSQLRLNFLSSHLVSEAFESSPSPDDFLINKNLPGAQKTCGYLQTVRTSTPESLGDEYASQRHENDKCNSSDAFSKLELHSRRSSGVEGASGLEDVTKDEHTNHEKLNIDQEPGKELVKSSFHRSLPFNNTSETFNQTDMGVHAESKLSLVQKRRMMFESKKDHADGNKIEPDSFKPKIHSGECGRSKSLVISSTPTKLIVDNDGNFADSSENISTDKSKKEPEMVAPDISLPHVRNIPEGLTVNLWDKKNLENQTREIFIPDNSPTNATKVNLDDDYPENLNPFNTDDEEVVDERKEMKTSQSTGDLTNPFDSDEETECPVEDKRDIIPPKPALRNTFNNRQTNQQFLTEQISRRRLTAPQINLNPFWSDEDECASDSEPREQTPEFTPVPKPRSIKHVQKVDTNERKSDHSNLPMLNSSLRSSQLDISSGGAYKKKKPAPLPPNKTEVSSDQHKVSGSESSTSTGYHDSSVHTTPKIRKTKPAPQPPILPSGTSNTAVAKTLNFVEPLVDEQRGANNKHNVWEDEKTNKDETNRNRQSFAHMSCDDNYQSYVNKSIEGKWKRKKGPAPPCPTPYRRKIKVMSLKDVKMELDEIELQQQGLEKQGVRLEQLIRSKCEPGCRSNDVSPGTDVEELVLELFGLVNEKNELFRRQAELMLLRRQQRLEEEHAEVEYQIRCLMSQHESTKTDFDKQKEEALIQRLVEIVERRNEIVDCLEMDRRREIEEDRSIHRHMDLFAARNKSDSLSNAQNTPERKRRKQNKLKEKAKDIKFKKMIKMDIDKDIDEIELKLKRHTKRKWF